VQKGFRDAFRNADSGKILFNGRDPDRDLRGGTCHREKIGS
jgi:hypothetical protein